MLTISELASRIEECQEGRKSIDDFEDWFCDASHGYYSSKDSPVNKAVVAVEAAFSRYYYEGIEEDDLREELAAAVRPFEPNSGLAFDNHLSYSGEAIRPVFIYPTTPIVMPEWFSEDRQYTNFVADGVFSTALL